MIDHTEHTETHHCLGSDGKQYSVLHLQEFIDASTLTDRDAVVPGLRKLQLPNGEAVSFIEEGKYVIVATGVTLTVKEKVRIRR